MNSSVKRIFTITKRNLKEIIRDPLSLIFLMFLPVLMEILFFFLFSGLISQFEIKYLAPGIVVFSQAFLCLFTGQLLSIDRATRFLNRLYVTPARGHEFIFGYVLALIPIGLLQTALFFIIGGILDTSFFTLSMLIGVLAALFTGLLFIGFGVLIGSICGEKSVGGVASAVIVCQSVLSGMWFPTEGLSGGMIKLMNILPFRNATKIVEYAANGQNTALSDILAPILTVLVYIVVVYTAAIIIFKRRMKEN